MKKDILTIVNKLEGWKTAIKNLHWDAKNLSQHRLCDDIAGDVADIQDTISEIEQSMDGNLAMNKLTPEVYKITNLKKFINDVIKDTTSFYKSSAIKGDDYIGMRSEIESFLAKMQRYIYLNDFCLKEDIKRSLKKSVNEGRKSLVEMNINDISNIIMESVNQIIREENKSGIHINPENKGKLTRTEKETGKSASELSHSKNPLTRKRAIFAINARKMHHGK